MPTEPQAPEQVGHPPTDDAADEPITSAELVPADFRPDTAHPATTMPEQIVGLPDWDELRRIEFVAARVAATEIVPKSLRNKPDAVIGAALAGRELRIPFMQALRDIAMVDGTPTPSAKLVRELIRRNGHAIECLSDQNDEHRAVYRFRRREWPEGEWREWSYTIEDAIRAGLVTLKDGKPHARSNSGKPLPWETYTAALLRARAITSLGREWFAECLGSMIYTAEELGETWVDEYGHPTEDTRSPEHTRWDNLLDALDEEQRDKAVEFFNQRADGRPFGLLPLERQRQWADWLDGLIAKRKAEQNRPAELASEHATAGHPEPVDGCPECVEDADVVTPDMDGDEAGDDPAEGVDVNDPEQAHAAITRALRVLAEADQPTADRIASEWQDKAFLSGPYWSQLEPEQARTMLRDIAAAVMDVAKEQA